jgi:hypothetical protein
LEIPEKKKGTQKQETAAAPGDEEILARSASKEEIRRGDLTLVTTLSLDEVDPS